MDAGQFKAAVASRISGYGVDTSGDEVCITGSCGQQTCSYGSPADCPGRLAVGAGENCVGPGTRTECTKIDASQQWIMYNNYNAICP
jgi:hypothetical protein